MDLSNALIQWINLQDTHMDSVSAIEHVSDGLALATIFVQIHPASAVHLGTLDETPSTSAARAHNLTLITAAISSFLGARARSGSLAKFTPVRRGSILGRTSSVIAPGIRHVRPPLLIFSEENDPNVESLQKLIGSVIVCSLQCNHRKDFISRMQSLDDDCIATLRAFVAKLSDERLASLMDFGHNLGSSMVSVPPASPLLTTVIHGKRSESFRYPVNEHNADTHEYLKQQLSQQARELESFKDENHTLNAEISRLLDATRKLLASQSELKAEKDNLLEQLHAAQSHQYSGSEIQSRLEQENADLRTTLAQEAKETDAVKERLASAEADLEEARAVCSQARKHAIEAASDRESLIQRIEDYEQSVSKPVVHDDSALKQIQERNAELDDLLDEETDARLRLEQEIREKEDTIAQLRADIADNTPEKDDIDEPAIALLEHSSQKFGMSVADMWKKVEKEDMSLVLLERVQSAVDKMEAPRRSRSVWNWVGLFMVMLLAMLVFNAIQNQVASPTSTSMFGWSWEPPS